MLPVETNWEFAQACTPTKWLKDKQGVGMEIESLLLLSKPTRWVVGFV